jgi:hypothetical protein
VVNADRVRDPVVETLPEELTWNESDVPTVSSAAGVSSPIPTLPFASTVSPEPDVEFDWNLASIPVVVAVEFAT